MKCYTIKSDDTYVADVYRAITTSWYDGYAMATVDCEDEAKQYKNKTAPKAWIKSTLARMQRNHLCAETSINTKGNGGSTFYASSHKKRLDSSAKIISWLEDAVIIEIDVESPNFLDKDHKIVWDRWRMQAGSDGKSNMKLGMTRTSKYVCKSCGLRLKNIPYYEIDGNVKVCIPCLQLRIEAIKSAYEGMPEDFRTNITNELILRSM